MAGRARLLLLVFAALLCYPAAASAAPKAPNIHEAGEAGRWGLLIAFAALVLPAVLAWYVSRGRSKKRGTPDLASGFRQLLIGADNRLSTSKTVAVVWSYLLAGGLLSIIIANWLGHGEAFGHIAHANLDGQYGLLIGGPLGAAILAKLSITNQLASNPGAKQASADGPTPSQLITNDTGDADVGDLQYVLFNAVAMIFFIGTLLQSPQNGIPHLPDVLLGLTSVSAAGYVAKKALPGDAPTASIAPISGAAGQPVTISGHGLLANAIGVAFGGTQVPDGSIVVASKQGTDTLTVDAPAGLTPGQAVEVVVTTASGAQVRAGTYTPTP